MSLFDILFEYVFFTSITYQLNTDPGVAATALELKPSDFAKTTTDVASSIFRILKPDSTLDLACMTLAPSATKGLHVISMKRKS